MHCPRCGAENEQGDRFCRSCGAALTAPPRPPRPLRERLRDMIGTTRRARLVSAGTAVAIVIAVAAFIALDPAEDNDVPRDAYTIEADRVCVDGKRQIVAAGSRSLASPDDAALERYAGKLVRIVAGWRFELNELQPPPGRGDAARALDSALRDVEVEAAALARVAREGAGTEALISRAEQLDELTGQVEEAISELGLDRCERAAIVFGPPPAQP